MLNPESVDYNKGIVRILFTDEDCYEAIKIYLKENDAWRLSKMLNEHLNMKAKEKRSYTSEQFDPTF